MFVVMVASECAPAAQAGGLGQVAFGLSRELELRAHAVEIILPKYDCMHDGQIFGLSVAYQDLWVPWYSGSVPCTVWFGWVHGRRCFFIEPHSPDQFFNRGHLYGSADDVAMFAFLSKAALEFMWNTGKQPEVIHCHEWQTAAVPVLLYEIYQHLGMPDQRVCYTIHNFAHQGICGEHVLWATGLTRPGRFFDDDRLRDNLNHMCDQPDEGRHRLLELHHHGVTAACLGGNLLRSGDGPGAHALHLPGEIRRRAQRHRLRGLEPGDRHPHPVELHRGYGGAEVCEQGCHA